MDTVYENRSQLSVYTDARLLAVGTGHAIVDLCANTLPIFYPMLAGALGLGYGAASALMTAQSTSSALGQPFFGWLADRFGTRAIAAVSVLVAGAAIALLGFAPSYLTLLIVVGVLGLAVGAYHPQGFKASTVLGGRWRASAMSVYLILGNGGYALGPLLAATVLAPVGLHSTAALLIPAVLVAAWLFHNGRQVDHELAAHGMKATATAGERFSWFRVTALGLVFVTRSWLEIGLAAFVPLLYTARAESLSLAGQVLFLIFLLEGPGAVAGGWAADRIGRKPTVIATFLLLAPATMLFLETGGISALLLAPVVGLLIGGSTTITMLAAQEVLPSRMGMASGIATSLATIMGGAGVGLQGFMADRYGLEPVTAALPVTLTLLAAVASTAIPRSRPLTRTLPRRCSLQARRGEHPGEPPPVGGR